MKTNFILSVLIAVLLIFMSFQASAVITVSIAKANNVPDNVCDNNSYQYIATLSGLEEGKTYVIQWSPTTGILDGVATISSDRKTGTANIKWQATLSNNLGQLKVSVLYNNVPVAESNTLSVTIKSIKHLTAELYGLPPSTLTLNPCESGTFSLYTGNMWVPGTGDVNPQRIHLQNEFKHFQRSLFWCNEPAV